MASGVVPRVMGSRSFCLALSGDCKCASWLAARTREAGCGIFMPEGCWASGSSKLDLEKDCVHVFRVEHKAFYNSASGNSWASPLHHFYVYVHIYKYIYTHIVSTQFYIIISHNTLQYPFKTMHWRRKTSSIRNVTFFQYFSLAFYPFLIVTSLAPKTQLLLTRTDVLTSKIIRSKHNSHILVLGTRAFVQKMYSGKGKWKTAISRFLD